MKRGSSLAARVFGVDNLGARMHQRRVRRRRGAPTHRGHPAPPHSPMPGYGREWPPPTGVPAGMPDRFDPTAWPRTVHPGHPGAVPGGANHPVAPAAAPAGPPAGWQQPLQLPVDAAGSAPAWDVLAAPRRDPWWRLARRYLALAAVTVVLLAGVVSIAGTVRGWFTRPTPPSTRAGLADSQFVAVAVPWAVDYLSWDPADRASRQAALGRAAAPNSTVDGWDGTGRQWADSPTVVGLVRGDAEQAVVTVRLRVIPFRPTDTPSTTAPTPPTTTSSADPPSTSADPVPNPASGPVPNSPGWTAQQPRWLNLAVALAARDGRIVVTAPPALVGSAPTIAAGPAVAASGGVGDSAFAQGTQDTVTTLLRAYGSGELDYARADGTTFTGLDNAATVDSVGAWRVRTLGEGDDPDTRVGHATVTWLLSGGAGKLTCSYRIELRSSSGRWYLASITVETEVVR